MRKEGDNDNCVGDTVEVISTDNDNHECNESNF